MLTSRPDEHEFGVGRQLTRFLHHSKTGSNQARKASSPEFYGQIITARTYTDRLDTLATVRSFGIDLCCGGIIGMGETTRDRASMLHVLAEMDPHPESVPINALVPVEGRCADLHADGQKRVFAGPP